MSETNSIPRLLTEWLDSNRHRSYPLDESNLPSKLPTQLFVDALFITSYNIDSSKLYITSVVSSGDNLNLGMTCYVDGVKTDLGVVSVIPFNTTPGSRIPVVIQGGRFNLSGVLVIGDISCMTTAPTVIELGESTGKIFPGCVRGSDETLIGISVNNEIYTGIVTLEAGDGIELTTEVDENGGVTVKISATTDMLVPSENMVITSDADILAAAVETYGRPVRSICGVTPDNEGNIIFSTPTSGDGGEEFVEAVSVSPGAISLAIANDTTVTSCKNNEAQIESLVQNISTLNDRTGEFSDRIRGLEDAQSNMSLQISRS